MTAAIWWGDPVAKVVAALAVALAVYLGVVLVLLVRR